MVILESKVSGWFPPPSSLKQLEVVLREEWYTTNHSEFMSLFQKGNKLHYTQMVAQQMCIFHSCFHYFVQPFTSSDN